METMGRRNRTDYPERKPGDPPPLVAEVARPVRFEEVDALGVVWHGRYPSYLEDGRIAFGEKYGLGYLDMQREGFLAPIAQMHIDYLEPLRFGETCTIAASLVWSESARLDFDYRITRADGRDVATAYTVQILTTLDNEVLLVWHEYLERFRHAWEGGELE